MIIRSQINPSVSRFGIFAEDMPGTYFRLNEGGGEGGGNSSGGGSGEGGGGQGGGSGEGGGAAKTYDEATYNALKAEKDDAAKQLREALAKIEKADTDKLSETERLKKAADDATTKATAAQERVVKSEVKLAAKAANVVDPDAAYALLDKSKIKLDSDGEPTNIEELITQLVKDKPYLVSTQQANASGSTANAGRQNGNGKKSFTREEVKAMSRADIAANWDAIQASQKTW